MCVECGRGPGVYFSAVSVIRSVGERHCNTVHKGAPFEVDVSMSTDGRANFLPDTFAIHVSSSNIQHHIVSKIVDTVRLSMHDLICAKNVLFQASQMNDHVSSAMPNPDLIGVAAFIA